MIDDVNTTTTTHICNDNVNTSNNEHHNLLPQILPGNPGENRELIPTYHDQCFNGVGDSLYSYLPTTMEANQQDQTETLNAQLQVTLEENQQLKAEKNDLIQQNSKLHDQVQLLKGALHGDKAKSKGKTRTSKSTRLPMFDRMNVTEASKLFRGKLRHISPMMPEHGHARSESQKMCLQSDTESMQNTKCLPQKNEYWETVMVAEVNDVAVSCRSEFKEKLKHQHECK